MKYLFYFFFFVPLILCSCSSVTAPYQKSGQVMAPRMSADYSTRVPQQIASREKTIIVNPRTHAWGAYQNGNLLRAGLATAGANWCGDLHRPCRTKVGSFRIASLGGPECKSTLFPLGKGGAPMPYCMFFNGNQGLHGSPYVVDGNASHGCVRMQVADAEWVRYHFANIGTRVVVQPY